MVIGGQAVLRHGRARFTEDIDLTVALSPLDVERVTVLLPALGLQPKYPDWLARIPETMVLPCDHEATGFGVDFAFADTEYERQAMARSEAVDILGVHVRYATVEDLVVHKLIASRPIDIEDVKSVLLKNPGLDAQYVRRWLRDFSEALDKPLLDDFEKLWRYAKE